MKKSNGWTIFWLIFFFPVGLYRMWNYRQFTQPIRIGVTVAVLIMAMVSCTNNNPTQTTPVVKEVKEETTQETKTEEPKKVTGRQLVYRAAGISIVKPDVKTVDVIEVVDGDTIKVKIDGKDETVRMILVDTPETKHPNKPVQPFGSEASDFTKQELNGKQVGLEFDAQERDQYGRLLAYVWTGNQLFNGVLIEKGYARVAVFPPNTKYVDQFRKIQDEARNKKAGIWSIENYATDNGFNDEAAKPKQETVAPAPQQNETCNIKGNISSSGEKIYHMPGQAFYDKTDAEETFCTESEAQAAGYRKSKR